MSGGSSASQFASKKRMLVTTLDPAGCRYKTSCIFQKIQKLLHGRTRIKPPKYKGFRYRPPSIPHLKTRSWARQKARYKDSCIFQEIQKFLHGRARIIGPLIQRISAPPSSIHHLKTMSVVGQKALCQGFWYRGYRIAQRRMLRRKNFGSAPPTLSSLFNATC